ncbi:MAG: tetratricopeptide repeat protein [Deltaproteobacteria bacterium]|jgi:tetratricopeptide (TPR) repeat protein|nr:tetratricopeptide repeat protein [Deltaproteobacteria bacterium]
MVNKPKKRLNQSAKERRPNLPVDQIKPTTAGPKTGTQAILKILALAASAKTDLDWPIKIAQSAMNLLKKQLEPDHPDILNLAFQLAQKLDYHDELLNACELYALILDAKERASGPDHPTTLTVADLLARSLTRLEQFEEARDLYARVHAAREKSLGPDHPETIKALCNLAVAYHGLKDFIFSRDLFQRAMNSYKKSWALSIPQR